MTRRGFTIVELLIAISIMLLLITAAVTSINGTRVSNRDARRITDTILIAKAVDSAALTRGVYPKNDTPGGSDAIMCASELSGSLANNGIDLSVFPDRKIPSDPRPVNAPPAHCSSPNHGYLYTTQYGNNPASQAMSQRASYSIEVLLEKPKPYDESRLKDLGTFSPSGRSRYVLNGGLCNRCYK